GGAVDPPPRENPDDPPKERPATPGLPMLGHDIAPLEKKPPRWLADGTCPPPARQKPPRVTVGGEPHAARLVEPQAPLPLGRVMERRLLRVEPRKRLGKPALVLFDERIEHPTERRKVVPLGHSHD